MQAVSIQKLSKTYPGGKEALKEISLSLAPGEVFGFLGPNGAGKTTTVKLLTGVLTPSGGTCAVFDTNPQTEPEKAHALSGIVTEHAQMYDQLTGLENLLFYASLFGLNRTESIHRAETLLNQLGLEEAKDRKLAAYSTGMRQRLSLARALLHRPRILFLDEPTSGLDPESAQNVNQMIHNLAKQEGITVFLCTHQLRYAQEICTRYGLLEEGYLLASGTLEELRRKVFSSTILRIRAAGLPEGLPFRQTEAGIFETQIQSEQEIPQLIREIAASGGDIYAVNTIDPSLEEIYFALTSKGKEEVK